MKLSRRSFLTGLVASTAIAPIARALPAREPLYYGTLGEYNGVIIRETLSIANLMRAKRIAGRTATKPINGSYVILITPMWADALFTPEVRRAHLKSGIALVPEQRCAA